MVRLNRLRELLRAGFLTPHENAMGQSASKTCALFKEKFAPVSDPEVAIGFVPGRIEVAGKHTDYTGGHTLVCAIDKGFLFVAGRNSLGRIRIAEDLPEFDPLEFPFRAHIRPPVGRWANYPMTMAQRIAANFGGTTALAGVDVAFSSTMPIGSGMSGSSALMMMCFCAICLVNRLHVTSTFRRNIHDGIDLAMYLACAENGQSFRDLAGGKGVGTFGGSEDHTAILDCSAGVMSLYQYAPTVFKAAAAWPSEWDLVVSFSGVRAEKTGAALEEYNLASRRASLAVSAYNRLNGTAHRGLGGIERETRGTSASRWLGALAGKKAEDRKLDLPGRVRQFLLEERSTTPKAFRSLLWRDARAFGGALSSSHGASRRLLWNIVPEIDFLRRSAVQLGAAGATGFGAGFGGSIFALIETGKSEDFAGAWRDQYTRRYPERAGEASFFVTRPGPGIRVWDESGPVRFVDLLFGGGSSAEP